MNLLRIGSGVAIAIGSTAVVIWRMGICSKVGPFVNNVADGEATLRLPGTVEQALLLLAWIVGIWLVVSGLRRRSAS